MFDFLREVMSTYSLNSRIMLGGEDKTVEIDESAKGRKGKFRRGAFRGSGIKWIFGIIDRETKKCHIEHVPNRKRETLFPIINRYVARGTLINPDEFSTYQTLNQEGYEHGTVNHSENYVSPNGTRTNINSLRISGPI